MSDAASADTNAHHSSRLRHRFAILSLMEQVNDAALQFLVLRMNAIQNSFEFEFVPFDPNDRFLLALRSRSLVDRDGLRGECAAFQGRQNELLLVHGEKFNTKEPAPDRVIVLSTARFSDNYYSLRQGGVSVIALGNWRRSMAPPSLLEFVLTLIVREVIASTSRKLRGSVHVGTKGCPCDFTPHLSDVRQKVLSSYLCDYCRNSLEEEGVGALISEIVKMLAKSWLGPPGDPTSPTATVSALGHDLFIVKGLRSTFWEAFQVTLRQEGVKQALAMIATVVTTILVAALLVLLGLKA